jgi:hypothetical protein
LGIDREQDAARVRRLRKTSNDEEGVPIGIGVDRSRRDRIGRDACRVEIGPIVGGKRATASRVDRPTHVAREKAAKRIDVARGPVGRWLEVRMPGHAARRRRAAAARALGVAERQTELPGEVGTQEERQVGAIGLETHAPGLVLVEPEVVVEKVPVAIAEDRVEAAPARVGVERIVEEPLDPGRVEALRAAIPLALDRPHHAVRSLARRSGRRRHANLCASYRTTAALELGSIDPGGE